MLYDLVDNRELLVTLSAVEICDYFGSFEDLRYANKNAKAALGSILKQALCETDFNLSGERLFIKVRQRSDGGCTIRFTITPRKRRTLHHKKRIYIYEFLSCEDLLLTCEQIKKHGSDKTRVDLFRNGNVYRLLINEEYINRSVLALGYEYCDGIYKDDTLVEKTKEYWQTICTNTPINKIINS